MKQRRLTTHKVGLRYFFIRIYLTLLACLLLVVVLGAGIWKQFAEPKWEPPWIRTLAQVVVQAIPPATAPKHAQQTALKHLVQPDMPHLSLFNSQGQLLAYAGQPLPLPPLPLRSTGWHKAPHQPPVWLSLLPDQRLLVMSFKHPQGPSIGFILMFLGMISVMVAVVAYPFTRRMTRRLEQLKTGVEAFGNGQLSIRVPERGHDEISALSRSFNQSATRIENLLHAHKTLLANASHELRSPLARIRLALEIFNTHNVTAIATQTLNIRHDVQELDELVEEILLASRLDATTAHTDTRENVDLSALLAEECARLDVECTAELHCIQGEHRLLRRMIRNLLENACRYDSGTVAARLFSIADNSLLLHILDRGPGVAEAERERIFEPFYRPQGSAEHANGWGLGLALVQQIAQRHGGKAVCLPREGGGSCLQVCLPLATG